MAETLWPDAAGGYREGRDRTAAAGERPGRPTIGPLERILQEGRRNVARFVAEAA